LRWRLTLLTILPAMSLSARKVVGVLEALRLNVVAFVPALGERCFAYMRYGNEKLVPKSLKSSNRPEAATRWESP